MSAALGQSQLVRLNYFLDQRDLVAGRYHEKLKNIDGIKLSHVSKLTTRVSWFAYTIQMDSQLDRSAIIERLSKERIPTRTYFNCIHLQKPYVEKYGFKSGKFPKAEHFAEQNLALPFFPTLDEESMDYIVNTLKQVIY